MHGEYKLPGGKMVVADFAVVDGRLHNVMISGDFFLYPDEALEAITGALEGLDSGLSEDAIADAVAAAIPTDTELFGVTPTAIAIAVRRGLE